MDAWAAGVRARRERPALFLLLVVVALVLAAAWWPGPVPVLGNLHDLFIPFNAAAAVRQGLALHGQVHTPFGWIYFHLCHLADTLQALLAPGASSPGMVLLSGLLFFVPVALVWLGYRVSFDRPGTMPAWLLPFALALMTTPRTAAELTHQTLLWYGLYNNHNWGLLLMQGAGFAALLAHGGRVRRPLPFVLTSAAVLCLAGYYKASFFMAAVLVFVATVMLTKERAWRLVVAVLATVAVAVWLTASAGYDHAGYLRDLLATTRARAASSRGVGELVIATVAAVIAVMAGLGTTPATPPLRTGTAVTLVVVGALLAALGDWSRYWGYPLLMAGIVLVIAGGRHDLARRLKVLAGLFIAFNLVLNVLSLTRVIQLKHTGADRAGYVERTLTHGPQRRFAILVEKPVTATPRELDEIFGPQPEHTWARLAVASGRRRGVLPRYSNDAYMDAHEEALAWLRRLPADVRAGEVEFANALPVLAGLPLPPGHHWLHLDATVDRAGLERALAPIRAWQVVLIPVSSVDGLNQVHLNCAALRVLRTADVGLARVTPHYIYLARHDLDGVSVSRERWRRLVAEVMQPECERVRE